MKSVLLLCITLLVVNASTKAQSFQNFSGQIQKKCHEKPRGYPEARQKLYKGGQLPFIFKADTTYMLQSFDIEEGTFHGKIWNRVGSVDYEYFKHQLKVNSRFYFTKFMAAGIQQWDTVTIRQEESKHSSGNPERWVTAIRIIQNKDKKSKIDCIDFKYFFELHRDAIY